MQLTVKNNYDFLISYLPHYLAKNKKVQAFYKAVSLIFDDIDNNLNKIDRMWLIDEASEEFLDDLGSLVGEHRNKSNDEAFRKRIKLAFKLTNFVPHLNNLSGICKFYTGLNPEIRLGWEVDGEAGRYDIDFIGNTGYNFDLINDLDLDKIAGAGIKVNTRKCIDNYKTGFYSGSMLSSQKNVKDIIKREPICDFTYTVKPHSKTFHSNEKSLKNRNELTGGIKK